MTEDQILYQISLNEELSFAWLQWWGTLSLGVFAVAHFARRRLNLVFVVAILAAYWAFTMLAYSSMGQYRGSSDAYFRDLQSLESTAEGTKVLLAAWNNSSPGMVFAFLFIAVFVGANTYLIYSYISRRKSR